MVRRLRMSRSERQPGGFRISKKAGKKCPEFCGSFVVELSGTTTAKRRNHHDNEHNCIPESCVARRMACCAKETARDGERAHPSPGRAERGTPQAADGRDRQVLRLCGPDRPGESARYIRRP